MNDSGRPDNIDDGLLKLGVENGWSIGETPHEFLGTSGSKPTDMVYGNLVMHGGLPKPTKSAIDAALVRAQSEWDEANAPWKISRKREYPITEVFMEAYTEKEIGGDSTKWDAYVSAYNKVRTDHPKA